jgi:hypothetical protein
MPSFISDFKTSNNIKKDSKPLSNRDEGDSGDKTLKPENCV